jgi:hypothetical protein
LQIVIQGPKCGGKIIAVILYNSATGCNIIYDGSWKTPVNAYDYEGCDELRPIPIPTRTSARPLMRRSFVPLDPSFLKKEENGGPTWGMRVSQHKRESKLAKLKKVVLTYQRRNTRTLDPLAFFDGGLDAADHHSADTHSHDAPQKTGLSMGTTLRTLFTVKRRGPSVWLEATFI